MNGTRSWISDADVEAALDWLTKSAGDAAEARANRSYMEDYLRVVKSQIMMEHQDKPLGAQEREAYADPRYLAQLEAIRSAVAEDERQRFLREAMAAKIESWRTACSNERAYKL